MGRKGVGKRVRRKSRKEEEGKKEKEQKGGGAERRRRKTGFVSVAQMCNPSTWKLEAEGSGVQSQPGVI